MSRSSYYDVIVVGAGPPGLMVAGLLCRLNYRVLLLPQEKSIDKSQPQPHPITLLPPFGSAPFLDLALNKIGVEDAVHVLGTVEDTPLQIVTPDQRIDLFFDRGLVESELMRAFPDQRREFLGLYETLQTQEDRFIDLLKQTPPLPGHGFIQTRRIRRQFESVLVPGLPPISSWPLLLRILATATGFISNLHPSERSLLSTGHLILALIKGMRTVFDFSKLLQEKLDKAGVEVESEEGLVEEIHIEAKNVKGVKTLRGSDLHQCGCLISSLPISHTVELVPPRLRTRRFRLLQDAAITQTNLFVLNLVVPREVVPLGMSKQLLVVSRPNDPLEEENLLRVQILPDPQDQNRAWIQFGCLIPHRKRISGKEFLVPLQQKVWKIASWLIPFLDEFPQGRASPLAQAFVDERHLLYDTAGEVLLGLAVVPIRSSYRNLYCCSPEGLPGLGIEGMAGSALQTAQFISEDMKLKKLL